jgi:hypothetical protein
MRLPSHWYVCGAFTRDFTQPPPPLPEGDEIRVWLEEAQVGMGWVGWMGGCHTWLSVQTWDTAYVGSFAEGSDAVLQHGHSG